MSLAIRPPGGLAGRLNVIASPSFLPLLSLAFVVSLPAVAAADAPSAPAVLQVQELQRAIEELQVLKDPDLVDSIIRSLDKPDLREPIRGVLEKIDTPEARVAVAEYFSDQ